MERLGRRTNIFTPQFPTWPKIGHFSKKTRFLGVGGNVPLSRAVVCEQCSIMSEKEERTTAKRGRSALTNNEFPIGGLEEQ